MFYFHTHSTISNGKVIRVANLAYESKKKIYDIIFYPDGTQKFKVNCCYSPSLPKLPVTNKLLSLAEKVKDKMVEYLSPQTSLLVKTGLFFTINSLIEETNRKST